MAEIETRLRLRINRMFRAASQKKRAQITIAECEDASRRSYETQTLGLASLPTEILLLICSYIPYIDRFKLKLVGSRIITSALCGIPLLSFPDYLEWVAEPDHISQIKCPRALWPVPFDPFPILTIACVAGHHALLLRIFKVFPQTVKPSPASFMKRKVPTLMDETLIRCLEAASAASQPRTVQFILTLGIGNLNAQTHRFVRSSYENLGMDALEFAASSGHMDIVKLLVQHGMNVRFRSNRSSAIDLAAYKGHLDIVKFLSRDIHWKKGTKLSIALGDAAEGRHLTTFQYLLDAGATTSGISARALCPIHLAAKGGNETIFRILVDRGVKDTYIPYHYTSNANPNGQWCALHFAAWGGHHAIVKFILDKKYHPPENQSLKHSKHTALNLAAFRDHQKVAQELLISGFDKQTLLDHSTPLHSATEKNHLGMMNLLLDHGADINCNLAMYERTPLHTAAFSGHTSAAKLLLDRGAVTSKLDTMGETPLHAAASTGPSETVKLFLDAGNSIDTRSKYDQTPIMCSIRRSNTAMLKFFLEQGACLDNALHSAVRHERHEIIQILLQHNIDIHAPTSENFAKSYYVMSGAATALHLAAKSDLPSSVELLLAAGANVNALTTDLKTPLHFAVSPIHVESRQVLDILLQAGADINAKDADGSTALHIVASQRARSLYERLRTAGASCDIVNAEGRTAREMIDRPSTPDSYRWWGPKVFA